MLEKPSEPWRFSGLLAALLVFTVLGPVLLGDCRSALIFDVLFALTLLMATLSLCYESRTRRAALALGLPVAVLVLFGHLLPEPAKAVLIVTGHLCGMLFLLGTVALIVHAIFREQRINADGICGAVCGYLLLGLAWGVAYGLAERVQPGSLIVHEALAAEMADVERRGSLLVYFSFVTLTTLGYGDISPATPVTRTLAWMEAMAGQFYVAILVAGLVSSLVSRGALERQASENEP